VRGEEGGEYHICSAGLPEVVGEFKEDGAFDGVSKFSHLINEDISIYRHNGVWYIGSFVEWPPNTFYRCGNCDHGPTPPLEGWEVADGRGELPIPTLSTSSCSNKQEL